MKFTHVHSGPEFASEFVTRMRPPNSETNENNVSPRCTERRELSRFSVFFWIASVKRTNIKKNKIQWKFSQCWPFFSAKLKNILWTKSNWTVIAIKRSTQACPTFYISLLCTTAKKKNTAETKRYFFFLNKQNRKKIMLIIKA